MKKYARGAPPAEDPFAGVETLTTPTGLRVPAGGIAWLECDLSHACDFGGDHEIHVARVTAKNLVLDTRFNLDFNTAISTGPARPHGVAFK